MFVLLFSLMSLTLVTFQQAYSKNIFEEIEEFSVFPASNRQAAGFFEELRVFPTANRQAGGSFEEIEELTVFPTANRQAGGSFEEMVVNRAEQLLERLESLEIEKSRDRKTDFPAAVQEQFELGVKKFYDFLTVVSKTGQGIEDIKKNQPEMKRTIDESYDAFKKSRDQTDQEQKKSGENLQKVTSDRSKVQDQLRDAESRLKATSEELKKAQVTVQQHSQDVANKQRQINELENDIRKQKRKCRKWGPFRKLCDLVRRTKKRVKSIKRNRDRVQGWLNEARARYNQKLAQKNTLALQVKSHRSSINRHQTSINQLQAQINELAKVHQELNELLAYVAIAVGRTDTVGSELDRQVLSLDQFTLKIKAIIDHFQSNTELYNQLTSFDLKALQEKLETIIKEAEKAGCDLFGGGIC